MIAKIYLGMTALIYASLAIWCSVQPGITSKKVGFELIGGAGQSEFMTVYGGLEFGLALIFVASLARKETLGFGVLLCVLLHASLVVFRTISFFCFVDIASFTYNLAVGEWVITLTGIAILYFHSSKTDQG